MTRHVSHRPAGSSRFAVPSAPSRRPRGHADSLRPQEEWIAEHEQRMERSMSSGGSSEQGSLYSAAWSPAPIDHHRGRTPVHQRGRRATRERDPYAIGRGRDSYNFSHDEDHYNPNPSPPPYIIDDHPARGSRASRRESNNNPYITIGGRRDPYNFNAPTYVTDNDRSRVPRHESNPYNFRPVDHRGGGSRMRHERNPYDVRPVDHHDHHRRGGGGGRFTHSRIECNGGYIESTVTRNTYARGPMGHLSTFEPGHTGASRAVRDPALRESTRRASRR
ncbi:MAG: hypothetical protein L6R35_007605 [Caloplaca aegaea]|nr:MAG: hypothetical protein L6R35_007605 [Caloplaca aegaea]